MIGQVTPRLNLTVTDPLDQEPDGRLEITVADGLDGNVGNAHSATLAYAQRRLGRPYGEVPAVRGSFS